ncbi:MAG: phosphate acetyltransferase [Megasphaera sp.]|jgi:phosphate acetyltransferase|nr:phosphate acetyltransferase [Megasphaera sp.]MCH4188353.1 phosphate acetyltransferase [Megasphaera sp.]MCH4218140.1 phosphate acetyltransferase [Megasphaera sp.]
MNTFIRDLKQRVAKGKKKIVLPESDSRILNAAEEVRTEGFAQPILIGREGELIEKASKYQIDLDGIDILDPAHHPMIDEFAAHLAEGKGIRGMSRRQAKNILLADPIYFAASLVAFGVADGMVAGVETLSPDVLRAALQVIGPRKDVATISSSFIVVTDMMQFGHDGVFVVGDGDVVPHPTPQQLADIACNCVERARRTLGIVTPKAALLSYSTMGSARGESANNVRQAVQILSDRHVDFLYDGEMEADVAIIPAYGRSEAPRSPVAGQADVLIFPDLGTGNICCKMLEHVADAHVLGPLLQGLAKPVMDLSRVSTIETITDMIALCCSDAMEQES